MGPLMNPIPAASPPPRIEVTRYRSRNWAVWLDGERLAVTVYKKGATAVAHALTRLSTPPDPPNPSDTHAS